MSFLIDDDQVYKFIDLLKKEARQVKDSLGAGSADSFNDYKYRCGYIAGIEEAKSLFVTLIKEENPDYDSESV